MRARPPLFTIALIVCEIVTYLRLDPGGKLPPLRFDADAYSPRALVQGHFRLLATSTLLTYNIFMVVSICLSLLFAVGTYEVIAGHVRAIALSVVAAVLGPALVSAGLGLLVLMGSTWAETRLGTLDIGSSALIACCSGGVAGIARNKWFTTGLVLFLIGGLIVHHRIADWEHLLIFPVGLGLGRWWGRSRSPQRVTRRRRVGQVGALGALVAVGLVGCAWIFPAAAVQHGTNGQALSPQRVVDTFYPTPSLGGRRRVLILLPPGYDSTHNHYPVVELLHGYPGRPDDMFSLGQLQSTALDPGIAPFIAVIPDGNGPHHADSWFANIPSQRMGTAATNDLRPWVAKNFRITSSWSYAGLSSGGFAAAYLPLVDTRPVHAVCGLSGYYTAYSVPFPHGTSQAARNVDSPIAHLDRAPHRVFLAYGRGDTRTAGEAARYAAALRKAGRQVTVVGYAGDHSWSVWRPAFRACFREILPASGH